MQVPDVKVKMFWSLVPLAGLAASVVHAAQPNILFVFTDDQDIELGSMQYLDSVSSRIQGEGTLLDAEEVKFYFSSSSFASQSIS